VSLQYNALGSILYKSDVGIYNHGVQGANAVRPHAVQSIEGATANSYGFDANGNIASASSGKYRGITYTGFNLPDSQAGVQGPAGGPNYVWSYDEDHARIREVRTIPSGTNAGTRTTWYLHPDNTGGLAFESEVNAPTSPSAVNPAVTSNRHYLSAGGQSLGVLVSTGALPTLGATQTAPPVQASLSAVKLEYWHKDHLGSIAATTDHNGDVTARDAYDPFGKRRFANGNYDAAGALVIDWSPAVNSGTDRGFTGHEQLDDIGLTHMNGRMYDATIGRFLSVDQLVSDPSDLQVYNRYSYVRNDPLARTDPSGWADDKPSKTWDPTGFQISHHPSLLRYCEVCLFDTDSGGGAVESSSSGKGSTTAGSEDGGLKWTGQILRMVGEFFKVPDYSLLSDEALSKLSYNNYAANTEKVERAARAGRVISLSAVMADVAHADLQVIPAESVPLRLVKFGAKALRMSKSGEVGEGLPDATLVCRGGACKAENFANGSGVTVAADGKLSGVSTQSRSGASVKELAQPFKNNQVGVTTAGDIRRAGGQVTPDGHPGNPNHATVDGLTAQQLEGLFSPTRPNPVPPAQRGL
jgi:RHS repeat-associated protein